MGMGQLAVHKGNEKTMGYEMYIWGTRSIQIKFNPNSVTSKDFIDHFPKAFAQFL